MERFYATPAQGTPTTLLFDLSSVCQLEFATADYPERSEGRL
jgi:hypothetical protein